MRKCPHPSFSSGTKGTTANRPRVRLSYRPSGRQREPDGPVTALPIDLANDMMKSANFIYWPAQLGQDGRLGSEAVTPRWITQIL